MAMKRIQLQLGPLLSGFCQLIVIEILGLAILEKRFGSQDCNRFHYDEIA